MAQLTKIRALQIQNATETEGIIASQIKSTAAILTSQLAQGANFLQADGSVEMTGNLSTIPGTANSHAVTKGQLDTVATNASVANSVLSGQVSDEITARQVADVALGGRIDSVETAAAQEATTRSSADTTLSNAISAEATARQNADNSLQTQIDTEQAARISAVASANDAITAEAQTRAAADTALTTTVNGMLTGKADLAGNATQVFAVGSPTQDSHAANKAYVDGVAQGLDIKASVRVATTAPCALAGLLQIDGVQLGVGDRVLVKNQADNRNNGIYVSTGGSWSRADDSDNTPGAEFTAGLFVFVEEGDTNAQAGFACSSPNTPLYTINGIPAIEVGSAAIDFVQFSGAGQIITSTGLQKSGNTISISDTGVAAGTYTKITVDAQGRATSGANPTTLSGYNITDAAFISGSQTQTFQVQDAAASFDAINKGQLDSAISAINSSLSNGGDALAAETTARQNADAALQTNIGAETIARNAAITTEANNRISADNTLQANIDSEVTTRAGAITTVTNNINAVSADLSSEVSSRVSADSTLQSNIDATNSAVNSESTARQVADIALQAAIDAEALARTNTVNAEITARQDADNELSLSKYDKTGGTISGKIMQNVEGVTGEFFSIGKTTIHNLGLISIRSDESGLTHTELRAYDGAGNESGAAIYVSYSQDNGREIYVSFYGPTSFYGNPVYGIATAVDNDQPVNLGQMQSALTDESTARAAADDTLATNVTAISTNLSTNYSTTAQIDQRFSDLVNSAPAALDTLGEIAIQLAADGSAASALTVTISNEVTRAQAAENTLTNSVNAVVTDLANEVTRSTAAETVLTNNLSSEITRAELSEGNLQASINTETSRAQGVENVLSDAISDEITARTNAIAALSASNGVKRTGNDFSTALATTSGLVADSNGLSIDGTVITQSRLKVRDPFTGDQDGSNTIFTLSSIPVLGSEMIYFNGLLMYPGAGNDYLIVDDQITFAVAPSSSDRISINYTVA